MTSLKLEIVSLISIFLIIGLVSSCGLVYSTDEPGDQKPVSENRAAKIIDGDTFILQNQKKVRLIGINTPEEGQFFYQEAKLALKNLIGDQPLTLEKDVSDTDQYGRLLRYVFVGELFVNLEMVKRGFAHSYTYPPDVKYQQMFTEAQRYARESNIGLWQKKDVSLQVYINYDAAGNDNENINDEYVIIENNSSQSIDLSGYTLKDSGTNIFTFPDLVLKSKDRITIYSGKGTNQPSALYWGSDTPIWNNAGDTLYLRDSEGFLIKTTSY